jgi:hypothetical protein
MSGERDEAGSDGGEERRSDGDGASPPDGDAADPLDAAGVDPVVPDEVADAAAEEFPDDDEVRSFLREIAADVRGDSSESKQLSAILYRVSDLYDPDEQTSPEEIYLNVRHIMRIKAQGGIER